MKGNFQSLFGKGQGNIGERLGKLDAQSIGQTVGLASAATGIYNTWKPGARTQSQLVGDAEAALEASNIATLAEQGWYGNNWRGAERGGNISECKECNKMKDHIMKYYRGGSAKRPKAQAGNWGDMLQKGITDIAGNFGAVVGDYDPIAETYDPNVDYESLGGSGNPFINKLFGNQGAGTGGNFSNLLNKVGGWFNPNDEMGWLAKGKNTTYRGNEATRNKNMDEWKRLFNPHTVVGQDRTYDDSARQANEGIGYDKAGILANLGKDHKLYKHMAKNLRVAESGGNIDPNSQGPIEIEVEGGETIDGQDNKFIGPSHDQGGIITKANDGDFVYPKGAWAKRHEKRTKRQADILAKLEEAGIDTNNLV